MTKQTSDETESKYHITVEGANKVGEGITKMIGTNALIICDVNVSPEKGDQLETKQIKTEIKSETNSLGKIMSELYNLENCIESEKKLKINLDLDLYQMEKL